ncbi:hypothetical protein BDV09DRAFT_171880 [Aspergillus tetrazonus]
MPATCIIAGKMAFFGYYRTREKSRRSLKVWILMTCKSAAFLATCHVLSPFFISYFARHTLFPALSPSYIRTRPARSCSYYTSGSNLLLVVNRQHGLYVTSHPHSCSPLCMD